MTDVSSGGYGLPWSHTRTYSNRMQQPFDRGNGWNWNVENWPYLVVSPFAGSSLALLDNLYDINWFLENADGSYTTLFGRLKLLQHDDTNSEFRLLDPDGTVTVFNDMSHPTRPGLFKSITTPGGNTTAVVQQTGGDILEVQRSYTSGTDTITESYLYDFFTSGNHLGHLETCTLRRRVNTGAWQNVLKADYGYYDSGASFGSLNDLQTVTRYEWDGSNWSQLDVNYYRCWKAGETNGIEHGLKYVVGPEAYAKMVADGLDPLTATNSQVAQNADSYFEYNSDKFVTKEIVDGGSRTFTFSYTVNPNYVSGQPRDFNFWMRKTVETLPDGTQNIVYCNDTGQTMLKIIQSGTNAWYEFTRYDNIGRAVLEAASAAVSGYDDTYNDLLNYDATTGKYQYLKDTVGLIHLREFYATTGAGAAEGYLKCAKIKQGQDGTEIKLRQYEYTSHSAGGDTIYPVSKEILYPDDSNQTTTIETSYSYTFYTGTTQIEQKTTTLPVISTAQNGSGTANSFVDVFDEYGNLIWHKDERGFITRYKYDIETGAMTQQIDDVDTAQVSDEPSGWTTPTGGGLHLVTDYEHDDQGRITQSLGPEYTIDLNGTATSIRTAEWTVYKDAENRTLSGRGFQKTSDSTYTLVNPVGITVTDKYGNVTDEIEATRSSTSGKLLPTDSFPQSSYVRWTTHQYTDCCKLISTRVYHNIPTSGGGSSGTNYDQTDFGYDVRDRRNRVVTPGGTITFTVFDARSLPIGVYVGTNDTGATDTDPTGGGAPGNNMVVVTGNEYDNGAAGGVGNLTKQTQYVDASTTRVTNFGYDWRDRQTSIDGEIDFYEKSYYDNLDRIIKVERYDTTASGNLIGRRETKFDDLSRAYETVTYGVNPSTGSVGNSLTDKTWYDAAGNVMKQALAGSKLFTKSVYDGLNRETKQYVGFDTDETTYAEAGTVTGDTIFEQTETTYDAASNVVQVTSRQRYHNATGTGELGTPGGTEPKARVTYSASWQDGIGRTIAEADYGTNGGSALTRPSTVPARSDTVLVTSTEYDETGEVEIVTDPEGIETRYEYDDASRQTKLIENYEDSASSSSSSSQSGSSSDHCSPSEDVNRTTVTTYNADGKVATVTAWNTGTGDQATVFLYGTNISDSDIASSMLLRRVKYPDSTGDSDSVEYKYNRQSEATEMKDQNGTVHAYDYDLLGRPTQDRVTTLGTNVDGAVRRIALSYNVQSLLKNATSYDNATVGSGAVVNDVQFAYNDFGQRTTSYQDHGGAVNTSTTPKVQYAYADGSANIVRPTSITYPYGRTITYDYGTSGGNDDNASRVQAIKDGTLALAEYQYLGLGTVVEVDETEPDLRYTLVGTAGGNDPDTGDIYRGLDRFGRAKDSYWYDYGSSTDAARIQYGYNRDSSRAWRANTVAAAQSKHFDELYAYDGLQRLKDMQRGSLNAQKDSVTNKQFAQCWSLDETGNWPGFRSDDNGDGTWDLIQSRTANKVNEITDVSETTGPSWVTPAYDAAGNMTTVPQPANPTTSYAASYDAWNRLVKLINGTDTVQESAYDGRRYRVAVTNYVDGSLDETRHVYYTEDWQAVEERVDASTDPARQFVWGLRYIDDLVLRDRDTTGDGTLDERLYALQDGNWNVTAITDENGDVQERYAYAAYGAPVFLSSAFVSRVSSDYAWESLFTGRTTDYPTCIQQTRERFYNPQLGTWINRDPAEDDHCNLYRYVLNDPLNAIDPFGLFKSKWHKAITEEAIKLVTPHINERCLNMIVKANVDQDSGAIFNTGAFKDALNHGDDNKLKGTLQRMSERWKNIKSYFCDDYPSGCTAKIDRSLLDFGKVLHALQDVYSHSNYVERAYNISPRKAGSLDIPEWKMWDKTGSPHIPPGVRSGFYEWPWDDYKPLGASHKGINKDAPDTLTGRKHLFSKARGRSKWTQFEYAKHLAVQHTATLYRSLLALMSLNQRRGFYTCCVTKHKGKYTIGSGSFIDFGGKPQDILKKYAGLFPG